MIANRTVAISNSASPKMIWGLGGPEEDHQLHHCCWTGRVGEREEEEKHTLFSYMYFKTVLKEHGNLNSLEDSFQHKKYDSLTFNMYDYVTITFACS